MASTSCEVCGEEVDENEIDPHGHFDGDESPCTVCGDNEVNHDAEDHEYDPE